MEDNEQCNKSLAEEVNQLMDLEVLCNLKQLSIENDKDNDDEEDALLWRKTHAKSQLLLMK